MAQCKATSKQSGQRCKRPASPGREVCVIHGGRTPRGLAAGGFKHGRHSRFMPAKLLERYQVAESDPDLLSLRSETAILDARVSEIIGKLKTGETSTIWDDLSEQWGELMAAQRMLRDAKASGDAEMAATAQANAASAMETIGKLITAGGRERQVWDDLVVAIKDKQGVAQAEHRRLIDLNQMLTVEQVLVFATALLSLIKEHVSDREILLKISDGFGRMFNVAPKNVTVIEQSLGVAEPKAAKAAAAEGPALATASAPAHTGVIVDQPTDPAPLTTTADPANEIGDG